MRLDSAALSVQLCLEADLGKGGDVPLGSLIAHKNERTNSSPDRSTPSGDVEAPLLVCVPGGALLGAQGPLGLLGRGGSAQGPCGTPGRAHSPSSFCGRSLSFQSPAGDHKHGTKGPAGSP